ncbi:hypothetical protein JM93_03029 [Roseibium hamelinense]|uniref:Uncharacterized protein n=1 Tax=Roseibium hamelinense TaxID=150831 RepID=A0A562STU2_9HYPH|nr:hypothetical protein [Roseibium hamelinense]TWI84695.1 hypothetical protein JM93_03029 [Roseibium hamelinense]
MAKRKNDHTEENLVFVPDAPAPLDGSRGLRENLLLWSGVGLVFIAGSMVLTAALG